MPIINSGGLEIPETPSPDSPLPYHGGDGTGVHDLPVAGFCPRCSGIVHRTTDLAEDGRAVCICDACGREFAEKEGAPLPPMWWQKGEK